MSTSLARHGRGPPGAYGSYSPINRHSSPRIGLELFGVFLRGLRVLPAIAQGVAMNLGALIACDMGGKRNA